MKSDQSDAEVVGRVLAGDTASFQIMVERYQRLVYSYLLPHLDNLPEVEDLAQETFVKAFRYLGSFDCSRKFSTWLMTIARNLLTNHFHRSAQRARQFTYLDELLPAGREPAQSEGLEPGDVLVTREAFQQTFLDMMALPDDLRIPLMMRVLLDEPYQDIADALDLPLQTVKNRIFQARRQLREKRRSDHGL